MAWPVLALAGTLLLSACVLGPAPDPPDFGYRMRGDTLVVAAPRCASETVTSALVSVWVGEDGQRDGFDILWSARGLRMEEAREGVFPVAGPGAAASYADVDKPLSGELPQEFFVEVQFAGAGSADRDGTVDLRKLRGARLGEGEFMTWTGAVLTREQIDAQLKCRR
ncbi:hypothetical protein [Streptomyces sp. NPDC090025]|uniref:hypothetical protein n=1 Tax=Streptomyces sp. NPDC090025 TaxID=3365922 RepID=UPI0038329E49